MKKLVTAGILLVVMLLFLLSCGCSDSAQGVSTTSAVTNDKTIKPTAVTTAVRTQPVFVEEETFQVRLGRFSNKIETVKRIAIGTWYLLQIIEDSNLKQKKTTKYKNLSIAATPW